MTWPGPSQLYGRLLLGFIVANVATLIVSVFVTERFAREAYRDAPDWSTLAVAANEAFIAGGEPGLEAFRARRRRDGLDVRLFEAHRPLAGGDPPPAMRRLLDRLDTAGDSIVLRTRRGALIAGEEVIGGDGVRRQMIALRPPRPPVPRIEQLLLVQIVLSALVIGGVGWWLARTISRPVAAIAAATRRVSAGDLGARVAGDWGRRDDELGRLAADFDRMAARIEALVGHQRRVLQDVSHELRSPLARLNLLLDLARRGAAAGTEPHFTRAEGEIARLDRMIGEVLALSRMEAELPGMRREPVPLVPLVEARLEAAGLEAAARAQPLALVLDGEGINPETLQVSGNAALLERALDNLLANAIKFGPAGGPIEVVIGRTDDAVSLGVRDRGPGVPDAEREALFRPFYRGSNGATAEGHGLGLAIVARIARAHGGRVEAGNRPGGGLEVSLHLPLAGGGDRLE